MFTVWTHPLLASVSQLAIIAGGGEPLLLIHGLGSCTEDWEAQVSELARSFRVITYDVRGHGRTGKPPGPNDAATSSLFAGFLISK